MADRYYKVTYTRALQSGKGFSLRATVYASQFSLLGMLQNMSGFGMNFDYIVEKAELIEGPIPKQEDRGLDTDIGYREVIQPPEQDR